MEFTFYYEVSTPDGIEKDEMVVEGESEQSAREYAEYIIEEKYPEDTVLLELVVK